MLLFDRPAAIKLKLIMRFYVPYRPAERSAPTMCMILVTDMMLMKNYRNLPIRQLHIMKLPHMMGILAHDRHIVLIHQYNAEIFLIYRIQFLLCI